MGNRKYDYTTARYSRTAGGMSHTELNHVNRIADSLTLIADLRALSQVRIFKRLMRGYRKFVDEGSEVEWKVAADHLREWASSVSKTHSDLVADGMKRLSYATTIDTASGRDEE